MGNSLLTISMITKEALRILKNNLGFTKSINRQYDDQFANTGAKIGSVINIRKPVRFVVSNGPALVVQDVADQYIPLTLSNQKHVGFQFSSKDLTLSIDQFNERYIAPAVASLANQIDYTGLQLASGVWNTVGTPGAAPTTLQTYLQAFQKLDENSAPMDGKRYVAINPAAQTSIVNGLTNFFNPQEIISSQYEKGRMGAAAGMIWKMDQNIGSYTVGTQGGTPTMTAVAGQTGSSINTMGWTASVTSLLNVGDVFTIAGVYAVNRQNFQQLGSLQQFVVTAATSSSSSGTATIQIAPSIITSGPYQTCSAAPAASAAITVLGTGGTVSPMNLAFHQDAFVLGCADLMLPGGVDRAARASDPDSGLSVRIVRAYDINNDVMPCRLDILYGWCAPYPELACRIQG
jgi:hypothetical protein